MTKIIVKQLIWDNYNIGHIGKHGVTKLEVELAITNLLTHKRGKKGRYLLICRVNKRLLSILVSRKGSGLYYIVTARDSAKKERKKVYKRSLKSNDYEKEKI